MIIKSEVKPDANHFLRPIIYLDGVWDSSEEFDAPKQQTLVKDDFRYFYGINDCGFVNFGAECLIAYEGHGPGYVWSSRPGVINVLFDIKCLEVIILDARGYRFSGYITLEKVLELLEGSNYFVTEVTEYNSEGAVSEKSYHVTSKNDSENNSFNYFYGELDGRKHTARLYPEKSMRCF